jgi:hypothetical protein
MVIASNPIELRDFTQLERKILSDTEGLAGRCFAMNIEPLTAFAKPHGLGWHLMLQRLVIAGLWQEHSKQRILIAYELLGQAVLVYAFSTREPALGKLWELLRGTGALYDTGRGLLPPARLRVLALREPPSNMFALWPPGLERENDGDRMLDTCSLAAYFSFREDENMGDTESDLASLEFVRIPTAPTGEFELGGRRFTYENRFAVVTLDGQQIEMPEI